VEAGVCNHRGKIIAESTRAEAAPATAVAVLVTSLAAGIGWLSACTVGVVTIEGVDLLGIVDDFLQLKFLFRTAR
jgi:hypothetical protein